MSPAHNIGVRVVEPAESEPRLSRHLWVLYDGKSATAVWGYGRDDVDALLGELRGALTRVAEMAEAGTAAHDIHEVAARAVAASLEKHK